MQLQETGLASSEVRACPEGSILAFAFLRGGQSRFYRLPPVLIEPGASGMLGKHFTNELHPALSEKLPKLG